MKRFSIAAVVATLVFVCALAGCAPAQSADKESLKGFWVLDESAQMGFDAAMNLDDDDFVEFMIGDSYFEGSWKTDGSNATVEFDEGSGKPAKIFVSDGKLTLGQANGPKLVFVKGNMESYFAEQEKKTSEGDVATLDGEGEEMEVVDEVINDITPVTIADDDNCTIKVTGKGTDFTADPGYRISITNKGKKAIYITADDAFKVGDKEVEAGLGEVVEPGETLETFLYFPKDDLGGSVEALKNVTGTIVVGDDTTGDEIKDYPFKMD